MNDRVTLLVTALVGGVGSIVGWLGSRRKDRSDAVDSLASAAARMVDQYQEDFSRLQEQIDQLKAEQRRERDWCEMRIAQLVSVLIREGIDVPPAPRRD